MKRLPSWQAAARVCRAMMELAETGKGDVRRVGQSTEYRLYVPPYVVRFTVDVAARTILVWTVFSMR